MKVLIAIQARMGSTRFPGKVMALLFNRPLIDWVVQAAKYFKSGFESKKKKVDICLLTSDLKEDDILENYAKSKNIKCVRGEPEKVIYRYIKAIAKFWPDYVVRLCGDSPFVLSEYITSLIENGYQKYIAYSIKGKPAVLQKYGVFPELFEAKSLIEKVINNKLEKYEMEHINPLFSERETQEIKVERLTLCEYHDHDDYGCYSGDYIKDFKFSVDYPEDLERCEKLLKYNNYEWPISLGRINYLVRTCEDLKYEGDMMQPYDWMKNESSC